GGVRAVRRAGRNLNLGPATGIVDLEDVKRRPLGEDRALTGDDRGPPTIAVQLRDPGGGRRTLRIAGRTVVLRAPAQVRQVDRRSGVDVRDRGRGAALVRVR